MISNIKKKNGRMKWELSSMVGKENKPLEDDFSSRVGYLVITSLRNKEQKYEGGRLHLIR